MFGAVKQKRLPQSEVVDMKQAEGDAGFSLGLGQMPELSAVLEQVLAIKYQVVALQARLQAC